MIEIHIGGGTPGAAKQDDIRKSISIEVHDFGEVRTNGVRTEATSRKKRLPRGRRDKRGEREPASAIRTRHSNAGSRVFHKGVKIALHADDVSATVTVK